MFRSAAPVGAAMVFLLGDRCLIALSVPRTRPFSMSDGPRSSSLFILCAPSVEAMPGAQVLKGLSADAVLTTDCAIAGTGLLDHPKARLAIFCPDPVSWVAIALAEGEAPSKAVANWRLALGPLMGLLRARRRQTVLLFDQIFAASPAACINALGLAGGEEAVPLRAADDPVLVMIAREALRRDPVAQALADELIASAFTPDDGEADQSPDAVFDAYRASLQHRAQVESSLAQAEARLMDHAAQSDLLRDQIRLDESARQEMQAQLTAAQQAIGVADAARSEAEARIRKLEDEAALLRDQIRLDDGARLDMQAQLMAAQQAISAANAARAEADATLKDHQTQSALLRDQIRLGESARQEIEAQLTAAQQANSASAKALHVAQARLKALEDEAALLRDQIRLDAKLFGDMQAAQHKAEQLLDATRREGQAALAAAEDRSSQMIRHLREQIHQIGQGLESYHAQVDALQAERADLLGQIRELHGAREDLEGYYDRARLLADQVDGLTQDIGRLQAELIAAQNFVAEGQHHTQFLEAEIARIHRSRSYRMATPLRKIRKLLG